MLKIRFCFFCISKNWAPILSLRAQIFVETGASKLSQDRAPILSHTTTDSTWVTLGCQCHLTLANHNVTSVQKDKKS